MRTNRREFLAGIGGATALKALGDSGSEVLFESSSLSSVPSPTTALPAKGNFAIPEGVTYINSAFIHPMPVAAAQALREYVDVRSEPGIASKLQNVDVKAEFAALINAKPSEISFVPNTSTGENLVVNGLGIPHTNGNVVTDALHFEGALLQQS